MPDSPPDILDAMERGDVLTQDQLRRLIEVEAKALALQMDADFEEVIHAARIGALPKSALGADLTLLVQMLDGDETA